MCFFVFFTQKMTIVFQTVLTNAEILAFNPRNATTEISRGKLCDCTYRRFNVDISRTTE
jgi:hypothetical protein